MTDLRTKIERAALAACNEGNRKYNNDTCKACCDECLDDAVAFLRALESEGLKLMDGEVTEKMVAAWDDAYPKPGEYFTSDTCSTADFKAMFAAAPTLADRLKEEK